MSKKTLTSLMSSKKAIEKIRNKEIKHLESQLEDINKKSGPIKSQLKKVMTKYNKILRNFHDSKKYPCTQKISSLAEKLTILGLKNFMGKMLILGTPFQPLWSIGTFCESASSNLDLTYQTRLGLFAKPSKKLIANLLWIGISIAIHDGFLS